MGPNTDFYQYSFQPNQEYISNMSFNVRQFAKTNESMIGANEYKASSFDNQTILSDDPEFEDNAELQLKDVIFSITNPQNMGKDAIKIRDVLLLTHPIFVEDSCDILSLLEQRFLKQDDATGDELQWQIQSKVVSFLQHWIRHYYYQDFELSEDDEINIMMDEFIKKMQTHFNRNKTNKI